jgi:membrane protein implicated in regulation of membrane protease activity
MDQAVWAWAIFGLVLLSVEMLSGTFYILWFGIAALCVAMMAALFPDVSLAVQLLSFAVLSVSSLAIWRRGYKFKQPGLRVGQAQDDSIGKIGRLTAAVSPEQNGTIAFTVPVMGSREWAAISEQAIEAGEQAEVVAVVGNYLRVQRKVG